LINGTFESHEIPVIDCLLYIDFPLSGLYAKSLF
jgi:hypothetical protein